MVTIELAAQPLIVAEPNRSATWQQNKWLLAGFGAWFALMGGTFAALGLWVILPFAGLEIAGLGAGLYAVCWKLNHRHVLRFHGDTLTIEKGVYRPRQIWHFPRAHTALAVTPPRHPWDTIKIVVCGPWEDVPVGDFLDQADSRRLLDALRAQGLTVRSYSPAGRIEV